MAKAKKIDKTRVGIGVRKTTDDIIKDAMDIYEKNAGAPISKVEITHKLISIGKSTWDMTKAAK